MNNSIKKNTAGILLNQLSDHLPCFTLLETDNIYIYNSVLKRQHAILKNGARTPCTVTKFAVKTAIDLTKVI